MIAITNRGRPNRWLGAESGTGILDVVFALGLIAILSSISLVQVGRWRQHALGLSAARTLHLHARLARARAIEEGVHIGLVFRRDDDGAVVYRLYRDGNANGIRQADIASGVDEALASPVRLDEYFAGSAIRVAETMSGPEQSGEVAVGSDPVRLSGGSAILSCAPTGGLTAGTVYVAGPDGGAYAVRALGATGRLRLFEFRRGLRQWVERS